jgi:hypothetical protein
MFLIGWGNRFGTLYNWVRSCATPATAAIG